MAEQGQRRKLAAILSADVFGYSRLMQDDEAATVETLTKYRNVYSDFVTRHDGRVVDSPGNNILAEFDSPVEAVQCAVEIQRELGRRNLQLAEHRQMHFRIGINLGDILSRDDGTLYGDGVNIAARLEGMAEPGGICLSETVYMQIDGKVEATFENFGGHKVKNITKPVRTYRVVMDEGTAPLKQAGRKTTRTLLLSGAIAVVALVAVGLWWTVRDQAPLQKVTSEGTPTDDPILAMPTGPAIAVLPFKNISGDEEQEYFSDGITEDIITELSRFDELHVISRNSTFQFKGEAVDVREVAQELGADYVVEGSVRKAGTNVRVTAQLLDSASGSHLWADSFDRELTADNIFEVQDEIVGQIVTTIADAYGIIATTRLSQARRSAAHDLGAYECVLRAHEYYGGDFTPEMHLGVRECLALAVEADPTYADAWIWLAGTYRDEGFLGYNARPNPWERMETALKRGLELDPDHQAGHAFLSDLYKERKQKELFIIAAERAIEINPNSANVLAWMGSSLASIGEWERGIALMKKGIVLSRDPPPWMFVDLTWDHYRKGEYEAALAEASNIPKISGWWEPYREEDWRFYEGYALEAAIYGQLGQKAEAEAVVAELLAAFPEFVETELGYMTGGKWDQDVIDHFIDGLRKAGLDIPDARAADQ